MLGRRNSDEAPRLGPALPLELERRRRFRLNGVANELVGRDADQDATGRSRRLQTSGKRYRLARDHRLPQARVAGDDLARRDPDPRLDFDAVVAEEIDIERDHSRLHLVCRPNGPQRVVLVDLGDAEHRHHGVADELLDRAAVAFDDRAHRLEVPREDAADGLGVMRSAETRRVRQVAEEHRHDPPAFGGGIGGERGAARPAVASVDPTLCAALRTGPHINRVYAEAAHGSPAGDANPAGPARTGRANRRRLTATNRT